jgi:hypothetical protein
MSKQAMGDLVDQCEAWGLVAREPTRIDARARLVRFTPPAWPGCRRSRKRWRRPKRVPRRSRRRVAAVVMLGWKPTRAPGLSALKRGNVSAGGRA